MGDRGLICPKSGISAIALFKTIVLTNFDSKEKLPCVKLIQIRRAQTAARKPDATYLNHLGWFAEEKY
jgi:hypothetical protein